MRLIRDVSSPPAGIRRSVLALGNFDGVHRGHQAVIGTARAMASREGAPLTVMTFEPHPRSLFNPSGPPFRLTPLRAKLRLMAELGVDAVVALRFNLALSMVPAETFARQVLIEALQARHIVVGYDYVFGHRRQGTPALLEELGAAHGFGLTCVAPAADSDDPEPYSSTRIRSHLQAGAPAEAAAILGRAWTIEGRVRLGRQLGRTIGVPTANIALYDYLRPAFGVYACTVTMDRDGFATAHPGVANIGLRPTVDGTSELLEVHLFDYHGDLYGAHLRVALVDFLRGEVKFDGLPALKAQIGEDMVRARAVLAGRGREDAGAGPGQPVLATSPVSPG